MKRVPDLSVRDGELDTAGSRVYAICKYLSASESGSWVRMAESRTAVRVLSALEYLCRSDRPVLATELALHLSVSLPTAFRALNTLEQAGFAERDVSSRGYLASLKVLELGGAVINRTEVKTLVRADLLHFAQSFEESVTLAIPDKDRVVFIDRIDAGSRVRFYCDVGRSLPLHAGAVARCVLAHLPVSLFETYLSRDLEALTPRSRVSADALRADREEVRRRGYAISHEEVDLGVSAVAAPILNSAGTVVASFSIANLTSRWTKADVLQRARAARDLGARLSKRCAALIATPTEQVI